jgi:hypothetical protein
VEFWPRTPSGVRAFPAAYSFGVLWGFEEGGGGISGDEFGTDGDVGGGGVCSAQPAAMAVNAMAARVDLVRFIFALLYRVFCDKLWILKRQSARFEARFA